MYHAYNVSDAITIGILNINAFMLKQGLDRKTAIHVGKSYIIKQCLNGDFDWSYNIEGCPVLHHNKAFMSVSHTSHFLCVAINQKGRIGVDIEIPQTRLRTVRSKFLNDPEQQHAGDTLLNLCGYWCAKEALFKYHGKKGFFLKSDFTVRGAWPEYEGRIPSAHSYILLRGFIFEEHCCVYAYEKNN